MAEIRLPEIRFTPAGVELAQPANGVVYAADPLGPVLLGELFGQLTEPSGDFLAELQDKDLVTGQYGACGSARDAFMDLRCSARFWDYADPQALSKDAQDMRAYARESAHVQPSGRRACAHPCGVPTLRVEEHLLVDLAQQVFVADSRVRFFDQQVSRKLVPSIGARHGLNCHAVVAGADEGQVHLLEIREDGEVVASDWPVATRPPWLPALLIGVDYERYQWRYRSGWVYQCIYLDLGHVVAAMRLLANHAGVNLSCGWTVPDLLPESRPLANETLLVLHQVASGDSSGRANARLERR